MANQQGMFPEGYFYILSRKHGFALDVYDGQTKEGASLIVWPQKFQDSDNQLWSFDNGHLTNKKSGHVMDISSSAFRKDKTIVQKKRKPNKQSQEWIYDQGFICSKEYPSLVLDIRGDSPKGGAEVLLYKRKDTDNLNQLWQFEPYQQFESALNMATTSIPLHKKENFGQPRPGYAAEPGVPPELKQVPENNKIAGVGNNVSPSNTTNGEGNSRMDPLLANYGSFYGGSATAPPPAQPGQVPSSGAYPPPGQSGQAPSSGAYPPPPPSANNQSMQDKYPPPPHKNDNGYPTSPLQSGPMPSPSAFPEPIPANATSSFQSPPPPPAESNYPPSSGAYPPSASGGYPAASGGYPSSPNTSYPPQHSNNNGYPPSSPSNYGYPAASSQMPTSPSFPSYPPSNSGYPPSSGAPPSFPEPDMHSSAYQQPPSGGMHPPGNGNHQPSSGGYPAPPPLPGNRPNTQQHDQYGYPSYPQ